MSEIPDTVVLIGEHEGTWRRACETRGLRLISSTGQPLTDFLRGLDRSLILVGRGVAGRLVPALLERGLGTAGIAVDCAPAIGAPTRAPLLVIVKAPLAHLPRASMLAVQEKRFYRGTAITEQLEVPHRATSASDPESCAWVAGYALDWALRHAAASVLATA